VSTSSPSCPDVVLVGAGIMSATLGVLLKELQPDLTIEIFESLDGVATESSDAWNNAGTGHAALCELNYTPQKADGSIAALLGASPGASTAVAIMLELIGDCFGDKLKTLPWQAKLKEMIPSHGESLISNAPLHDRINSWTRDVLGLREAAAVLS
jgi:L-2-hydroxyglutarate oxidase LhgO